MKRVLSVLMCMILVFSLGMPVEAAVLKKGGWAGLSGRGEAAADETGEEDGISEKEWLIQKAYALISSLPYDASYNDMISLYTASPEIAEIAKAGLEGMKDKPKSAFCLIGSDYASLYRYALEYEGSFAEVLQTYEQQSAEYGFENALTVLVSSCAGAAALAAYSIAKGGGFTDLPEALQGCEAIVCFQYEGTSAFVCFYDEGVGRLRYTYSFADSEELYTQLLLQIAAGDLEGNFSAEDLFRLPGDRITGEFDGEIEMAEPLTDERSDEEFICDAVSAHLKAADRLFCDKFFALYNSSAECTEIASEAAKKLKNGVDMITLYGNMDLFKWILSMAGEDPDADELDLSDTEAAAFLNMKPAVFFSSMITSLFASSGVNALAASSMTQLPLYHSAPADFDGGLAELKDQDGNILGWIVFDGADGISCGTLHLNCTWQENAEVLHESLKIFCSDVTEISFTDYLNGVPFEKAEESKEESETLYRNGMTGFGRSFAELRRREAYTAE